MLTLCSKYENLSFSAKPSVSRSEVNFFAPQHNISACPRQERMEFQPCSFDTPATTHKLTENDHTVQKKGSFWDFFPYLKLLFFSGWGARIRVMWCFTEHVKQSGWKSMPDTFMILKDNKHNAIIITLKSFSSISLLPWSLVPALHNKTTFLTIAKLLPVVRLTDNLYSKSNVNLMMKIWPCHCQEYSRCQQSYLRTRYTASEFPYFGKKITPKARDFFWPWWMLPNMS